MVESKNYFWGPKSVPGTRKNVGWTQISPKLITRRGSLEKQRTSQRTKNLSYIRVLGTKEERNLEKSASRPGLG